MEKINLLQEKRDLLLKALTRLESNQESLEEKLDAIDANEPVFYELKKLQIKIQGKSTQYPKRQQDLEEEILELLKKLQEAMAEFHSTMTQERIDIQSALGELNKSKRISSSYVQANQGPIYVDKDFV